MLNSKGPFRQKAITRSNILRSIVKSNVDTVLLTHSVVISRKSIGHSTFTFRVVISPSSLKDIDNKS